MPASSYMRRSLRGARILLAEDESLIAMDFAQAMRDAGAVIIGPAATVGRAFDLGLEALDMACLDVNLRGEMVYPVADLLRMRGIPFVFTTGYDEHNMPPRFRRTPYAGKPLNPRHLVALLDQL